MTTLTNSLVNLFDAPSTKWDAVSDAVTMLTDESAQIVAPTLEGDTLSRYAALSMAADSIAARLDRWTLNTALTVALIHAATEKAGQAPNREQIAETLARVPAFMARNTPEGKDAVPPQTFNRCIAGAALHMYGSNKARKAWEGNAEINTLGGVAHWKSQKLDKAGLTAAIASAETKSAGRTKAKQNQQGSADKNATPADAKAENKALAQAAQNALKSVAMHKEKLAAFASDVRATVDNASLNADQLRAALREMCDAIEQAQG